MRSGSAVLLVASVVGACGGAPPQTRSAQGAPAPTASPSAPREVRLEVSGWRVVERESGPVNYYQVVADGAMPFIRAHYRPPLETTVLGYELDDATRAHAQRVRWKWRAVTLPNGGDECTPGKGDSAAVVYVTWKRGLRYYSLKYVWSAVSTRGSVCDSKRNLFVAQDTIVLESGEAGSDWKSEEIDLRREFLAHFSDGDEKAQVPAFFGVGIMTDGDQTQSESVADYADFVIVTDAKP